MTVDDEPVVGPWMEVLVWRYRIIKPEEPARPRRIVVTAAVLLAIGGALAPALMRLDHEAYPSEPERQQALEICGQSSPTFVRFFAADRYACYERFPNLARPPTVDR